MNPDPRDNPQWMAKLREVASIPADAYLDVFREHRADQSHFDKELGFVGRYFADWHVERRGAQYDSLPAVEYDVDGIKVLVTEWRERAL